MKKWFYDYAGKCDCAEDDKCGCSYPNNMAHDYDYVTEISADGVENIPVHNSAFVGGLAVDFEAPAVMADNTIDKEFNLFNYINGSYALLFFYPADFSFMCPSEIIAFNQARDEFAKRDVKMVAVSVDSPQSHLAWKRMPINEGGIGDVKIPLVSDLRKSISFDYGVLSPEGSALRASFIIDREYRIRYQTVHDRLIGREVSETLRVLDVLQNIDRNGAVCAHGWEQSAENIRPTIEGTAEYMEQHK